MFSESGPRKPKLIYINIHLSRPLEADKTQLLSLLQDLVLVVMQEIDHGLATYRYFLEAVLVE